MTARADRLMFPAAAVFAAAAIPLWVLQYSGLIAPWRPPVPYWHGHEMVFGFALAIVGGYLMTRVDARTLALACGAWLAGRVVALALPLPAAAEAALALAYPAMLFVFAGLPFLRAAKGWHNAVFGPAVGGFALAEALYQAGSAGLLPDGGRGGVMMGVSLVALLLFAMGGRVSSAATSGALQRQGLRLRGLNRTAIERAGVAALLAMAAADALGWDRIAAAAAVAAGLAAAVRLAAWKPWLVRAPEVSVLHLGYGWLAAGFFLKAAGQGLGLLPVAESLHGITIGALGTLAVAMTMRATQQRDRRPIVLRPTAAAAVAMVNLAAVLRLAAVWAGGRMPLIEASAVLWTASWLAMLGFLLAARRG